MLEALSDSAQNRLLEFFADRPGPLVQLGFGLNLGTAVVGAIGSQRKIDATYLSTVVDFSEFLESSTKTYGVRMLMSNIFWGSLNKKNRRRCRKVDDVCTDFELASDEYCFGECSSQLSVISLYTLDLDIEALWQVPKRKSRRSKPSKSADSKNNNHKESKDDTDDAALRKVPELDIPHGFVTYKESDWQTSDMLAMRKKYVDPSFPFYELYSSGLEAFYNANWAKARRDFLTILNRFEDGPSRYFLKKIEANNCCPPTKFHKFNIDL